MRLNTKPQPASQVQDLLEREIRQSGIARLKSRLLGQALEQEVLIALNISRFLGFCQTKTKSFWES